MAVVTAAISCVGMIAVRRALRTVSVTRRIRVMITVGRRGGRGEARGWSSGFRPPPRRPAARNRRGPMIETRREHAGYTVDELAARVGMSARNIRAYQARELLPPPRRVGRSGYYSEAHVRR